MWKLHIRPVSASVEAKNIAFGRSLHLMHAGVTILYNSFFYCLTVFFIDSFKQTSRLKDILRAWLKSTKLCRPLLDCGMWRDMIPMDIVHLNVCLLGWVFAICETDYYSDSAPEKFMAYVVSRRWYCFVLLQENIQVPVKFSARCCHWLRGNVTYLTGDIFVVIIHCDTTWKCLACAQELVSSQFSQSQNRK